MSLLQGSNLLNQLKEGASLTSVEYEKGLSLLLVLDKPCTIPYPGCLKLESGPVSWIADNSQKEGFSDQYCITVHANPQYADETWNDENNEVAEGIIKSIEPLYHSTVMKICTYLLLVMLFYPLELNRLLCQDCLRQRH